MRRRPPARRLLLPFLFVLFAACGDDGRPDPTMTMSIAGIPDPTAGPSTDGDIDGDGVANDADNCPSIANADQRAACTYPSRPPATGDVGPDAVARLNWHRTVLGLETVTEDAALSAGCATHLDYLVQVSQELGAPQLSHGEDLSKPYASEQGAQAGTDSVLSLNQADIALAVDGWMDTLYHRLPLIHPGLMRIGADFRTASVGGRDNTWACVQYRPGTDGSVVTPHPVLWPPADIVGTARAFDGNESPCPTAADPLAPPSCPSSAAIPSVGLMGLGPITAASGTFTNLDSGAAVPLFATYYDGGPSPHEMMGYVEGTVALVPEPDSRLDNALYEVRVDATVGGVAEIYRWRFRTGRPLPDVGCDDLGENRDFASAIEIETGTLEGRVCDFADMYLLTGEGTRVVRIDFDHGEGDLDMVALDPSGMEISRSEGVSDSEELSVNAGLYVQVYGAGGAMGPYILTVE